MKNLSPDRKLSPHRPYHRPDIGNEAAQTLYKNAGFELLNIRKGYYRNPDGTSDDAVVMMKRLKP